MNNFELHEKAINLSDKLSKYQLARLLVQATRLVDYNDRFQDNDMDYKTSPFGNEVRDWLSENLLTVHPDADFATFTDNRKEKTK